MFFQESRRHETFADLLLAASFLSWGAILIGELLLSPRIANSLRALEILPQLFAAALMVMGLYEEEKRRVEQNMLALSNVNLATSSFVGPEIQQMLSHALERVLSVVRMPAGALFPASRQPGRPDLGGRRRADGKFLRGLPGRGTRRSSGGLGGAPGRTGRFPRPRPRCFLGGAGRRRSLPAFPAARDRASVCTPSWGSACKPRSRRSACCFWALRIAAALRQPNCVCCWRWAIKLAWPSRIAYLVQQTARRTQELHMLNEIGRALELHPGSGVRCLKPY